MGRACSNCNHFFHDMIARKGGTCRRYPPVETAAIVNVDPNYVCGEHGPRKSLRQGEEARPKKAMLPARKRAIGLVTDISGTRTNPPKTVLVVSYDEHNTLEVIQLNTTDESLVRDMLEEALSEVISPTIMDKSNPDTWDDAAAKEFIWDNLSQKLRDAVPFRQREEFLDKLLVDMRDRIASMTNEELMNEIKLAYEECDEADENE